MSGGHPGRHRGLYWSAVLLALVVVVGGSAVAYRAYQQTSGPDGAVKGYFAALARSDAAAALAYGDVPAGPHTLLTANVLREQQRIAPIHNVHVVTVAQHGADAHVTVNYALGFGNGAQQVTDSVPVHRSGSSWRLVRTAVPATIRLTEAIERASIVGAGIPAGKTLLFPGAVPIRFDTLFLQITPDKGYVDFDTGSEIDLAVEVTDAGRKAVASALVAALRACVGAQAGPRCPLPSDRIVPGSLRGHVTGSVAAQMSVGVDSAAAGVIDVTGTVSFVGSYRRLDYNNVASTHHGTVQLPLDSTTYAVAPVRLQWADVT